MKLKCNICDKVIECKDNSNFKRFTEHLTNCHITEIVDTFSIRV